MRWKTSSRYSSVLHQGLLLVVLLLIGTGLFAQKLSLVQVKSDLYQLQNAIHQYNPALDRYNPAFDKQVDSLVSTLGVDSIWLFDYFQYCSRLCAFSNEGHFSLGNWQDTVHSGFLANRYHYFPLSIKLVQRRIYVWKDFSEEKALNQGDEILSINGLKTAEILVLMEKMIPSDGHITTYAERRIESGFSWLYYLNIAQTDGFHLQVKDGFGIEREMKVKALERKAQFENSARYYPNQANGAENGIDSFYSLKYDNDIAYLTLPSFDYRQLAKHKIKSKKFYKRIFKELASQHSKYLVIDLRNNSGGRIEMADDMVPFIDDGSNHTRTLRQSLSWKGKLKTYKIRQVSKYRFEGKIYVLVNGSTYSAGSMLARYFKEYGHAILIGEESGTRYEGFSAGSTQYITLTHSQLKIGIPRYHIFFPESQKQATSNRGVLPLHTISYSIDDLIHNRDLYLEKANALIKLAKQKQP